MNQYVAMIPYTQNGYNTGPYLWANQGASNAISRPSGAPGCRVGATVGQFLMLGDLFQTISTTLFTGNGSQNSYSGYVPIPMLSLGSIADSAGDLTGTLNANGTVTGTGYLSTGSINFATGALSLTFSTAPPNADIVSALTTQFAPYRVWWSAIGDPTNWPTPLTANAIAFQSGYQDLDPALGPVMFIAGYPLYGLIFQRFGITLSSYQGGNVVFSFGTYERAHGLIAHGAAVKVSGTVYFLADDGFYATDGANVAPIGTAPDNSAGIDNWFWANVNQNALEAIRSGYDPVKRCVFWAIPTGANTLPDTLLAYNILAQRWTRSSVASECIWTSDNGADNSPGTRQVLGVFDQTHTPNLLNGATLTGYLESCDLFIADANRRFTSGVRAQIQCTDNPIVTLGAREGVQSQILYNAGTNPDPFSLIAPQLVSALYTRARLASGAASAISGVTLLQEVEGPL